MSWLLINKEYDKKDNKHYEGAFAQGNGYINLRASFDEDLSEASQNDVFWRMPANVTLEKQRHILSKWGTYIPGIYGNHPILGEEIINLPYSLGMNIMYKNNRFDMNLSEYTEFERILDLRNGVLERRFNWIVDNNIIRVKFKRYCSMSVKNMIVQTVEIISKQDGKIKLNSFMDAGVTTNGYNHFKKVVLDEENAYIYVKTDSKQEVGLCSHTNILEGATISRNTNKVDSRINQDIVLELKANQMIIVERKIYYATSIDDGFCGDIKEHLSKSINNSDTRYDIEKHNKIWHEKWSRSDIIVGGNEGIQTAIRFSIYHLLRSVNNRDDVAIDAKGYAGEAYYGHYFWDTEVYLLPFYIYTQPEYAKKLIRYRYKTLNGAKRNAKNYGYSGAKYSWESCISGEEQCSNWQYADLEVHVTADVIFGLLHYCQNANDMTFLMNEGIEMMIETARYWMQRLYKKEGKYHLLGVMGPDEYLAFTNNNTFTNYIVRYTLQATLDTILLAEQNNEKVLKKLKIDKDEMNTIQDIINNIVLLIDEEKTFIEQCDNFNDFEDIDIDKIWTDKSRPFGQFISQERNYRSKVLKQADVIALLYLFRNDFDEKVKRNCIDYYEPLTTHDSSLSYIFHSLVYSDINEVDKAYEMFYKSIGIDIEHKGAAEGIHIANCGGIWQGLVMGFGGQINSMESDEMTIMPHLPEKITYLDYKIFFKGEWYSVHIEEGHHLIKKITDNII